MRSIEKKTVAGKLKIKTFDGAAENFNLLTASKTTLMRHVVVPKPDKVRILNCLQPWEKCIPKN